MLANGERPWSVSTVASCVDVRLFAFGELELGTGYIPSFSTSHCWR